jgi:hypothetical protein
VAKAPPANERRRWRSSGRTIEINQNHQTRLSHWKSQFGSCHPTAPDAFRTVPQQLPVDWSETMRSDKIHRALDHGMNRFEVCQLVAKGVKATHKTGGRFEDSINDVLDYLGTHNESKDSIHPVLAEASDKALKPAA